MFRKAFAYASRNSHYGNSLKAFKYNVATLGAASSVTISFGLYGRDQKTYCEAIPVLPFIPLPNVQITQINMETIAPEEGIIASIVSSAKSAIVKLAKGTVRSAQYAQRILLYALYGLPLFGLLPASYVAGSGMPAVEDFTWDYIIWSIQRLGPCFIKLAQWASTRPDLFPPKLVGRLVKLQDDVHVSYPRDTIERTLSAAFGDNWMELIELDPEPLGAGSVAQVFKGKLKTDMKSAAEVEDVGVDHFGRKNRKPAEIIPAGRAVAIKMIHPHVEALVRTDMELLSIFASVMDKFPSLEILSLGETCRQFADTMNKQLDLRVEAENLIKFTQKFAHDQWAAFPVPLEELISRSVIVETLMEGTPINSFMDLKAEVGDSVYALKMKLSDLGCRLILKMVFFDNFVHGDLHPGTYT